MKLALKGPLDVRVGRVGVQNPSYPLIQGGAKAPSVLLKRLPWKKKSHDRELHILWELINFDSKYWNFVSIFCFFIDLINMVNGYALISLL